MQHNQEQELILLREQNHELSVTNRRILDQNKKLRENDACLSSEIIELRTKLLQRDNENSKLNEELNELQAKLQDAQTRELKFQKLSKKYRDEFYKLKKVEILKRLNAENSIEQTTQEIQSEEFDEKLTLDDK